MLRKLSIAAGAALLLLSGGARAASINPAGSTLNGNTVVDLSTDGQLSLDVDLHNLSPILLQVDLSTAERAAGSVSWNTIFTNLTPQNLGSYVISVVGAQISLVGDLTDTFQTPITSLVTTPTSASITFPSPGEAAGFELGNPLGFTSADWELSSFEGSSLTLELQATAAPEPAMAALLGLGTVLVVLRRRAR